MQELRRVVAYAMEFWGGGGGIALALYDIRGPNAIRGSQLK